MNICFLSGLKETVGQVELQLDYTGKLSGLLEMLCDRYGQQLQHLLMDPDSPDAKNPFLKILVDGRDVKHGDPELTGDETLFLFLPIAGG